MGLRRKHIGIDPGTQCGWAVLDADGERIASGEWNLKPRSSEGMGMRWVRLERWLTELLLAYPDALLAYELVVSRRGSKSSTSAGHVYGGVLSVIERVCLEHDRVYVGVNVSTVKGRAKAESSVEKKGQFNKDNMIEAARERWPSAGNGGKLGDNEADALWTADCSMAGIT